jgi:predicted metalloprotease with PDZ domain
VNIQLINNKNHSQLIKVCSHLFCFFLNFFFSLKAPDDIDQNEIRHVVLKEALGLDFNSFIPEGDSQVQTHFISNVQPSSMADKAGLRDGDRILTVNGVDVTNSIHEDVRRMMQSKKPLKLSVVNDPKYLELIENVKRNQNKIEGTLDKTDSSPPDYETVEQEKSGDLRGKIIYFE